MSEAGKVNWMVITKLFQTKLQIKWMELKRKKLEMS